MMVNIVEINNCKHYLINEGGSEKLYFFDTAFMVERDFDINHPFGDVYRPKNVIDTPIRFVKQKDNSAFVFKAPEWNVKTNPFYFNIIEYDFPIITKFIKKIWQKEFKTV
jgi:hypothetical protein